MSYIDHRNNPRGEPRQLRLRGAEPQGSGVPAVHRARHELSRRELGRRELLRRHPRRIGLRGGR